MFKSPGHIAYSIASVDIHYYGIIMAFAILAGLLVVLFLRKKYFKEISVDTICDISFLAIIFGIICARLYYVVLDYRYFIKNPLEIPAIWNGGIAIHGAILGGIIAVYCYTKDNKLNFLRYADLFSFGLIIGQAIGRWGNFFNSEAFGLPCSLPWKLYIPYTLRPFEYKNYEYFHPAFLYESILNILIFFVLYLVLTKLKNKKDGCIFFLYILLYSIVRLLIETIRVDSVLNIYNIHAAHIAAFGFIIAAIAGLYTVLRNNKTDIV